jgi:hypothetical protein
MSTLPDCTAEAVMGVLALAEFPVSEPAGGRGNRTDGLYAADLPLAEPRVAIYCWPVPPLPGDDGFPEFPDAESVLQVLAEGGYRAEIVVELMSAYIVAWTEGDF